MSMGTYLAFNIQMLKTDDHVMNVKSRDWDHIYRPPLYVLRYLDTKIVMIYHSINHLRLPYL